jgi:hypothetical protein
MPNSVPSPCGDFAFIGSLAIMTQFSFRPKALRPRTFDLTASYPSGQENCQRFRKVLAHPHRTDFSGILCRWPLSAPLSPKAIKNSTRISTDSHSNAAFIFYFWLKTTMPYPKSNNFTCVPRPDTYMTEPPLDLSAFTLKNLTLEALTRSKVMRPLTLNASRPQLPRFRPAQKFCFSSKGFTCLCVGWKEKGLLFNPKVVPSFL